MLAYPTTAQARPIFAGRSATPTTGTTSAGATEVVFKVRPVAPWSRGHLSFRGTRIFTSLTLGWVGLILVAFGAIAVPAANDLGRAAEDAGLMALLGSFAPIIWGLGIVHLVAAVGIARDRVAWGLRLATWLLAAGVLAVVAALVFSVAGRDAFSLIDPVGPSAAQGRAILVWTLGLYAIVGWGLRRILTARQLV